MTEPKRMLDENTGKEILVYDHGMIKDAVTGHIIKPSENGKITTSERGRELQKLRHEQVKEKIRNEILRRTKMFKQEDMGEILNTDDAYVYGVGKVYQKTVLDDKAYPRDALDAIELIGKIGDFIPKDHSPLALPENEFSLMTSMSLETAEQLWQIIRMHDEIYGKKTHGNELHAPVIIDLTEEQDRLTEQGKRRIEYE